MRVLGTSGRSSKARGNRLIARCVLAALSISILLASVASPSTAQVPATVTVTGVVRTAGGAPVEGMSITFANAVTASAVTGPDGSYSASFASGSVDISLQGDSATSSTDPLPVIIQVLPFNTTITASQTLDLTLPATTTVNVHVEDRQGAPVSGASLSAPGNIFGFVAGASDIPLAPGLPGAKIRFPASYPNGNSTNPDGDLALFGFAGTYAGVRASVTTGGQARHSDLADIDAAASSTFTFTIPDPADTVAVSGVVRTAGGAPVAGAQLEFSNSAGSVSKVTGQDGSYSVAVAGGSVGVQISTGSASSTDPLPATFTQSFTTSITSDRTLDLTLPATTTVSVHARDPLGAPIPGASLRADIGFGIVLGQATVSLGPDLPATQMLFTPSYPTGNTTNLSGNLTMVGFAGSYQGVYAGITSGGQNHRSSSTTINATVNAIVTFTLPVSIADGALSGRVTGHDGEPIEGARVWAYSSSDGWVPTHSAVTDANGDYSVTAPPGAYRLLFIPPANSLLPNVWYLGASSRETTTAVTIPSGSTRTGVDQQLTTGSAVSGRITGPDDEPIEGAQVWAYSPSDGWLPGHAATTDADGDYTVTAPAGTYRLLVMPPADTLLPNTWYLGASSRETASPVVTTTGSTQTGVDVRLALGSGISGHVGSSWGTPIAGMQVWAYSPADVWVPSYTATTDANGKYTIVAPPGTYRVAFIRPLGFPAIWHAGASTRDTATPVVTVVGSIQTGIDLTLPVV